MDNEAIMAGALSGDQLRGLIQAAEPLLEGWRDLEAQLQPNGIDLTLREVARFSGAGTITADNAGRVLPDLDPLPFAADGSLWLEPGAYHILYNEVVRLPPTLMALGRPRSSLGRCGVSIHTAVWDAGYHGRSTSLLVVSNPAGFHIAQDARVMQLVFFTLSQTVSRGYQGAYQGENLIQPTGQRTRNRR